MRIEIGFLKINVTKFLYSFFIDVKRKSSDDAKKLKQGKRSNLKTGVLRKQSTPHFPKNEHLPPDRLTHKIGCDEFTQAIIWLMLLLLMLLLEHLFTISDC